MEEVEHEGKLKCEVICKKELEDCLCSELEERSKKAGARCVTCVELELDIQKKKREYDALEAKFRALEVEKLALEDELQVLKGKNEELKGCVNGVEGEKVISAGQDRDMRRIVVLTEGNEEEDRLVQLMIENKVLECEKKSAESEVKVWKEKFKELESRVLQFDENSVLKVGEWRLVGGTKVVLGLQNVNSHEVCERKKLSEGVAPRDGLHVGSGLDYLQNKEKDMDLVDVGTNCHSPTKGICNLQTAGTPSSDLPYKHDACIMEERKSVHLQYEGQYGRQVRKQLAFEEERIPRKKIAPSTPGSARPASHGIIDISDSDDERKTTHVQLPTPHNEGIGKVCTIGGSLGSEKETVSENSLKRTYYDQNNEEDMDACEENLLFIPTPKRKRPSNIVTSDTESDDDDNVPISKLKRMPLQETIPEAGSDLNNCSATATTSVVDDVMGTVTPPRRRLVALRKCGGKDGAERNSLSQTSETKYHQGIPINEDVEDDESEEVGSDSDGESLGGFIVESSDVSLADDASDSSDASHADDASSESQDVSDDNMDFSEILSKIQRNKDHKSKWEFEADMLAAFGKDPELCMKAVCALYRQQTSEEQSSKGTFYHNQRGFSKFDALRGSTLAQFIIDGDPEGDVKKTVEELQEYDPKAVDLCRTLATRYSKQLFEIYQNKEDPLFFPS